MQFCKEWERGKCFVKFIRSRLDKPNGGTGWCIADAPTPPQQHRTPHAPLCGYVYERFVTPLHPGGASRNQLGSFSSTGLMAKMSTLSMPYEFYIAREFIGTHTHSNHKNLKRFFRGFGPWKNVPIAHGRRKNRHSGDLSIGSRSAVGTPSGDNYKTSPISTGSTHAAKTQGHTHSLPGPTDCFEQFCQ